MSKPLPLRPLGQPLTEREVSIALLEKGYSIDQIYEFLRRKPL